MIFVNTTQKAGFFILKINIKPRNIFLEPFRKNTCPAITLSVLEALKNEDDPYLLVLASDHLIKDIRKFQNTIRAGIKYADQGRLVTFGIIPDYTETGYGYIETNVEYSLNDFKGISLKKFPSGSFTSVIIKSGTKLLIKR